MNCLEWNCQGLGKPRTVRALSDLIKDHKPSFLFLSETISYVNKVKELRVRFGFEQCFSVDRVGRSGGLAVLWKQPFQCQIFGYSQHHIDVLMSENNNVSWRLSCLYGYPERTRRRDSWNLIRRLAGLSSLLWCIWGDFNDLLFASDKYGKLSHPQCLMDGFRSVIDECMLSELNLLGGKFTWEKGRGTDAWVREKLDRSFATDSWWSKFSFHNLKVVHAPVSDHEPIILELFKINVSRKSFRFRFENMWLKEPEFVKEVKEIWCNLPMVHLIPKLTEVSSFMARWGRSFFHKFREKLKVHKKYLDRLADCTDDQSVRAYLSEKEKLNALPLQEEIYWKQRAKLFCLSEGDENSRFFHSSASARKKANKINFMCNDVGDRVEDQEGMCEFVKNYFKKMFAEGVRDGELLNQGSHITVTGEQNMKLVQEFFFEEFTAVIKEMHSDKASAQMD